MTSSGITSLSQISVLHQSRVFTADEEPRFEMFCFQYSELHYNNSSIIDSHSTTNNSYEPLFHNKLDDHSVNNYSPLKAPVTSSRRKRKRGS